MSESELFESTVPLYGEKQPVDTAPETSMPKRSMRRNPAYLHPYFSSNLRFWMEIYGFSREDLARKAGMTPQNVGYYLRNTRMPDYSVVVRLAHALDLPIQYLWDHLPTPRQENGFSLE